MGSRPDSGRKGSQTTVTTTTGERVPPHSSEAEGALLGAVLIDNKVLDIVNAILKPDDFYIPAYRIVFEAMQKLGDSGYPLDIVTLSDELKRSSKLELAGGSSFLARLTDEVVSAVRAEDYAKLIKEKSSVRQMISAASQIAASGFGDYENAEEYLDVAEQQIFEAASSRIQSSYHSAMDVIQETFHYIEESYARGGTLSGISTGYAGLDNLTAGLQPGKGEDGTPAAVALACLGYCEYYRGDEGEKGCGGLAVVKRGIATGKISLVEISYLLNVPPGTYSITR